MNHCFISTPPASKQSTHLFEPLTSIYIYWHPDLPLWASVLSYKWSVLCSTLSWRSGVSFFLSILMSHQTVANWLCQVSYCEDWSVDKRVSSQRTLTLTVTPTNSRTTTGWNASASETYGLFTPRIKCKWNQVQMERLSHALSRWYQYLCIYLE